jgi:hypothetical protein
VEIKDGPKHWARRLIRRCGQQFGPDQRIRRGGHHGMYEKGRTAYHLDGLMKVTKDAMWLKMLIYN